MNFKKIISTSYFLIAVILFFLSCGENKNNGKGLIKGRLIHAENKWIHLQQINDEGEHTIDSVMAGKDGSFQLNNPADGPDFYVLRANDKNLIFLVLRRGESAEVNGDADNFELTYSVKGSKDSEVLLKLRSFDRNFTDSLNTVYTKIRNESPDKVDSIGMILQGAYSVQMEEFSKNLISKNLTSIVSLSATKFLNQQRELALMQELEDSLFAAYPTNRYVIDYKNLMAGLKKLPPGSPAPEIEANSPEGKQLSLSSLKGKIVLIDFWASWCAPCRSENPNLVALYQKYKGKDFEILGVSLDDNQAAWKTAIAADKITWLQVSELKKWESTVVKEYNIEAIPYSVLVDREGKIIAKGLRSEDLEVRLIELLRKNS